MACKEIMEMNDLLCKQDTSTLIEIKSELSMVGRWLFSTGAGISSILSQQFRLIPTEKRPYKSNLSQQEDRDASGTALIPNGVYLFPMQWNGKSMMQTVKFS
jgi:hypothetical protein